MPVKKYKPTSPGRRQMATSSFEEITTVDTGEVAARAAAQEGRPQRERPDHHAPPGRRAQAPLPADRLQASQGRGAGEGRLDRVRPEPLSADRAAPLRRRRKGVHPRARRAAGRRDDPVGSRRRHPAGQRPAARRHPDRHERPRGGAPPRPGREARALGGLGRAARREGRAVRRPPPAVGRDAPRPADLPRDRRRRSGTPTTPTSRAGRPAGVAGSAAGRPSAAPR